MIENSNISVQNSYREGQINNGRPNLEIIYVRYNKRALTKAGIRINDDEQAPYLDINCDMREPYLVRRRTR